MADQEVTTQDQGRKGILTTDDIENILSPALGPIEAFGAHLYELVDNDAAEGATINSAHVGSVLMTLEKHAYNELLTGLSKALEIGNNA